MIKTEKNGTVTATYRKSKPGWFVRNSRWEHGIERAEYERLLVIARSKAVTVVVIEAASPPDGARSCECVKPGVRLWAPLSDITEKGRAMPRWPDGTGGPDGEGGWIWPRSIMFAGDSRPMVQGRFF